MQNLFCCVSFEITTDCNMIGTIWRIDQTIMFLAFFKPNFFRLYILFFLYLDSKQAFLENCFSKFVLYNITIYLDTVRLFVLIGFSLASFVFIFSLLVMYGACLGVDWLHCVVILNTVPVYNKQMYHNLWYSKYGWYLLGYVKNCQ